MPDLATKQRLLHLRAEIVRLRLQYKTEIAIATELGINLKTVNKHLMAMEREWQKKLVDDPVRFRARELADLEEMERLLVERGIQTPAVLLACVGQRLKIKERKHKLLGLDLQRDQGKDQPSQDNRSVTIYIQGNQAGSDPVALEDWLRGILNPKPNGHTSLNGADSFSVPPPGPA